MLELQEIIKEIESLPKQQYINLRHWFAEQEMDKWDKEIALDSNSGKLDFLRNEAINEKSTNQLKSL